MIASDDELILETQKGKEVREDRRLRTEQCTKGNYMSSRLYTKVALEHVVHNTADMTWMG